MVRRSDVVRAALYARISDDRDGEGLGVTRQRNDCLRLAESRGWTITEEFVDNDRSASSYAAGERPRYAAMMEQIADRQFDAVVAYHQDRLTRRPAEFEAFLSACEAGGVSHLATVTGVTEIGQGDSILVARIFAAVAANQSDAASRRIRRKNDERAEKGLPHVSGERPFGYERDGVTLVPDEVAVIQAVAKRFISGESLYSLAMWLQAEGIKTATGKNDWRTTTLRNLMKSPRIAGLREHRGEVVGPAAWPRIISERQHARILKRLSESAATNARSPRRYLLSGKVYCARCGAKMVSSPDSGRRRYGCRSGPDFGGCGKVYISGEALDRLIIDAVLRRMESPAFAAGLAKQGGDNQVAATAMENINEADGQLEELAAAYAGKQISMKEWLIAKRAIEARQQVARNTLAKTNTPVDLLALSGGAPIRKAWEDGALSLQRQAAIVGALLDCVKIHPATRKTNRLDPSRVQPVWRL